MNAVAQDHSFVYNFSIVDRVPSIAPVAWDLSIALLDSNAQGNISNELKKMPYERKKRPGEQFFLIVRRFSSACVSLMGKVLF